MNTLGFEAFRAKTTLILVFLMLIQLLQLNWGV